MSEDNRAGPGDLSAEAQKLAANMKAAAAGRSADANAEMPLTLFVSIAEMLEKLSEQVLHQEQGEAHAETALTRIANLQVRGATELLELGAWKKICAELQAIAQEAAGLPKVPLQAPKASVTGVGGLGYI